MDPTFLQGLQWYSARQAEERADTISPTRDIFQARLDSMYRLLLSAGKNIHTVSLLTAVVGELGNNCFDHNLGRWNDVTGCWFQGAMEANTYWTVIADRGQGILASLRQVEPTLVSHHAALETAFRKHISGRAPEQRGNGLKFVRSVINGHAHRGLCCLSGDATVSFGGMSAEVGRRVASANVPAPGVGTCVAVGWEF